MRSAKRRVSSTASGQSRNSRAISAGGFQMTFGIGLKPGAGLLQSHMFADAGDDILQIALLRARDKARH